MTADIVKLPDDTANTGKKVDCVLLTVSANTVDRQVVCVGDPTADNKLGIDTGGRASINWPNPTSLAKSKLRDLAATVQAVKASAGTLYGLTILNNQGAAAYVQIFDLATGGVTLATTTPDLEILVPANSQVTVPLPAIGVPFATAISIASTTTEKGLTGSAAGVQVFSIYV